MALFCRLMGALSSSSTLKRPALLAVFMKGKKMIYRRNKCRFSLFALLLVAALFGNLSFSSARPEPQSLPAASFVGGWGTNADLALSIPADLNATAIAAGWSYSLALKPDGTVVGWGHGFGAETPPPGLSGVVAISAGGQNFLFTGAHALALKSDGTIVGWGADGFGQASGGALLSGVIAIAAGGTHSLALKSDGTVVGWGNNDSGQATPPAGLSGVVAIAARLNRSVALKSDGTVVEWGDVENDQVDMPAGLNGVIAIDAGRSFTLALKSDGTVVAWGSDPFGFGVLNVPAGLSGVVAISAAFDHSLALKFDGTVTGWGTDFFCESTPPSCISGVQAISAGLSHNLTLQGQPCVQDGCSPQQCDQIGCSPQTRVVQLLFQVQNLRFLGVLTPDQSNAIINKLFEVLSKLNQGQNGAACNQMGAVINQLNSFIKSGTLTPSQGQTLIDSALSVKTSIGC
jgi:hypothetical protein